VVQCVGLITISYVAWWFLTYVHHSATDLLDAISWTWPSFVLKNVNSTYKKLCQKSCSCRTGNQPLAVPRKNGPTSRTLYTRQPLTCWGMPSPSIKTGSTTKMQQLVTCWMPCTLLTCTGSTTSPTQPRNQRTLEPISKCR